MKSVEHPLIPVNSGPPTEEDLGFNLAVSSADTGVVGLVQPWRTISQLTAVWLLGSVVMAAAALFHALAGSLPTLAWSAAIGAVALLVGAALLRRFRVDSSADSTPRVSLLYLAALTVPLGQVLAHLILAPDSGATVLVLLLVIACAVITPSAEVLLTYLTLSLAAWTACVLRLPAGAWQPYVAPWFATTALALLIQQRRASRVDPLLHRPMVRRPSSGGIDVDLEQHLRAAVAARDTAQARCRLLEDQLRQPPPNATRWEEDLFFIQESARELAQDVTLNEVGAVWLERLGRRLGAKQASLWLVKDAGFRLIMGISEAGPADVDGFLARAAQAGQLLQTDDACALPIDLGMQGQGVLLLQGVALPDPAPAMKLLYTCGAILDLFLRWQMADAETETLTQQLHQVQEKFRQLEHERQTQDQTTHSVAEHLRQQLDAAQLEVDQLRASAKTATEAADRWKTETEQRQRLLTEAEAEYDTLSQLLSEAEAELKRLQADGADRPQLEGRLQQAEADLESATAGWQQADQQLREAADARQKAEDEARDAVEEWQRETLAVSHLTLALRGLADPVAVFDAAGDVLFENEAAQALRGPLRNRPGEHPLWLAVTPETLAGANRTGHWQGEVQVSSSSPESRSHQLTIRASRGTTSATYAIAARIAENEEEKRRQLEELAAARLEVVRSGSRFFGGLVKNLRPPADGLIDQAEAFLAQADDPEARRLALQGVLQHARHLRGFLIQAFDFAELESGSATIVRTKQSPWQVAQEVVACFRDAAEAKGLQLHLVPAGSLPQVISTDGDRLRRLLGDLFRFALRATRAGEIAVRLGLESVTATAGRTPRLELVLDLANSGHGFALDQLFEPFGDSVRGGLDLASARRQAEVLGGELRAERLTPKGIRLLMMLPLTALEYAHLVAPDQLPPTDEMTAAPAVPSLQGRVLVVLDRQETLRAVTFHLERLGLRTELTSDVESAAQRLRDESFQAVLWDGDNQDSMLAVTATSLREAGYRGAIFVVTSGPLDDPLREAYREAGVDGVLALPVVPALWRQALVAWLPEAAEDGSVGETLRSDFHFDQGFLPLVRGFGAKLPGMVAEMRAALHVADLAGLARLTHTLADNARLYGYPPLAVSATELEAAVLRGADSHQLGKLLDDMRTIALRIERGLRESANTGFLHLPSLMPFAA